jgi:hypothetical protein
VLREYGGETHPPVDDGADGDEPSHDPPRMGFHSMVGGGGGGGEALEPLVEFAEPNSQAYACVRHGRHVLPCKRLARGEQPRASELFESVAAAAASGDTSGIGVAASKLRVVVISGVSDSPLSFAVGLGCVPAALALLAAAASQFAPSPPPPVADGDVGAAPALKDQLRRLNNVPTAIRTEGVARPQQRDVPAGFATAERCAAAGCATAEMCRN